MMARSEASAVQLISLDDSTDLFLWLVDYSSYEACPYSAGKSIYGSLFVNKEFRNTALIGDESGGGDPPVWGSTIITSEISSEVIKLLEVQEFGDEDENYEEVISRDEYHHLLKIQDGYLVETETDYKN